MARIQFPQLQDEAWVRRQFVDLQRTAPDIAAEVGCGQATVWQALQRFSITARGRHYGRWKPRVCVRCGVEYIPTSPQQKYCISRECKFGRKKCRRCQKPITAQWHAGSDKSAAAYCSRECLYEVRRNERRMTAEGYAKVWVGAGVPGARTDGRMLEHRYVMQQHLGRPLRIDETVHHIDGDRLNNAIENLQLRSGRHGRGEVAVCADCGSMNIVFRDLPAKPG